MKAELTELKPVSDPSLTTMHTTMGIPNLAPPPPQQQSYDMMRPSGVPTHSPTFIAVPSGNLVQSSHPMSNGQGYTMRLSDHTQSQPISSNSSSVGYSTVGQSVMTTSPSYASRKLFLHLFFCLCDYFVFNMFADACCTNLYAFLWKKTPHIHLPTHNYQETGLYSFRARVLKATYFCLQETCKTLCL